jgi:NAD(P)H-dependent FMN reductase
MATLQIIIASTRPGRVGLTVGKWFIERARAHGAFELDVADLAEINLPFLDEPNHPRLHQYTKQHTKDWSARVEAADAFVIVLPEYNYGMPATIKNALDFLHREWAYKPVGFVSYGGVAAGTRSTQQVKQVVSTLKMFAINETVSIPFITQHLDEERKLVANETMEEAATVLLEELVRVERAMRTLRSG